MPLNKIQLKAKVFEILESVRGSGVPDEVVLSSAISKIKTIEDADFEFISKLIIKETDINDSKMASAFLCISEAISPKKFVSFVMDELNSKNVLDNKKMFLINALYTRGIDFNPEDLSEYLTSPIDAINDETSRFLENAKIEPDAQIDFLDFYFASSKTNRMDLIENVISDSSEDKKANILSAIMLSTTDADIILFCLNLLEKSKSLILYRTLKYLSKHQDKKVSAKASKMFRKLSMQGIFSEEKSCIFFKDLMKKFEKPIVRITAPDGNSNFSVVISRKTSEGAYYILFVAVNTEIGPFSCFGFSNISKFDHDSIMKRFFNSYSEIYVTAAEVKKILDTLTLKRISLGKNVPYEYHCWERLFEDILPSEYPISYILSNGLNRVKINDFSRKLISTSEYTKGWFFRNSKAFPSFSILLSKLFENDNLDFENYDSLIYEFSKDRLLLSSLKQRILYLVYCLKNSDKKDMAEMFYSLLFEEKEAVGFLRFLLEKSVLKYCLNIVDLVKGNQTFKKNLKINEEDFAKLILYIEKRITTY